jgi:hypothetical protein
MSAATVIGITPIEYRIDRFVAISSITWRSACSANFPVMKWKCADASIETVSDVAFTRLIIVRRSRANRSRIETKAIYFVITA